MRFGRLAWGSNLQTAGITYTTASDAWTVLKTGRYLVNVILGWATNATGRRSIYLYVNAVGIAQTVVPANSVAGLTNTLTELIYLNAGDVVEVQALQSSGAALDTLAGQVAYQAQISWIGD